MAKDERFNYESIQDAESIREYIQSLIEGLEKGRIVVSSNGEKMILHPGKLLNLYIKVKKKDELCKLSIKVSWKEETRNLDMERTLDMGDSLTISSG